MKKRKGVFQMTFGLLLLAAAFLLTGYNIYESKKAESTSAYAVREMRKAIENTDAEVNPLYEKIPDIVMPTFELDGERYIGILEIPALGLCLPVMGGEWSYPKLRSAPCRYTGSVYKDDLVIAAHNYSTHFGRIKDLVSGTDVTFTDVDGNIFYYEVGWLDVLKPNEVEVMTDASKWDMTLFTCTYGGRERYALRCIRSQ